MNERLHPTFQRPILFRYSILLSALQQQQELSATASSLPGATMVLMGQAAFAEEIVVVGREDKRFFNPP